MRPIVFRTIVFLFAWLAPGCRKEPVPLPVNGFYKDSRDSREYWWVRINGQVWMAENLAYLPAVNPLEVFSTTDPLYYIYGYNGTSATDARKAANYNQYGVLYNWPAARSACPAGWHLPDDDEWKTLERFLGMSQADADSSGARQSGAVGRKIKSGSGWDYEGGGDNSAGLNALPGGYRSYGGSFEGLGQGAGFWSSTENSATTAWYRGLVFYGSYVHRLFYGKIDGFSVRCIQNGQ